MSHDPTHRPGRLAELLAHPLTRGLDLDDPATTRLRRSVIAGKPFLRRLYRDWYRLIAEAVPAGSRPALELGSGAGFLSEVIPELLASDLVALPGLDLVSDGQRLPLADGALRAVVMVNVLHHVSAPAVLLDEAARCVVGGGALVMLEPWVTPWSKLVYGRLHHEPFDPAAEHWEVTEGGPLSGANGALPWILLVRDRDRFEGRFPPWSIERITPTTPLRYLLSGGVSLRSLVPGWTFGLWSGLEALLGPVRAATAMFALIVLRRR